MPSSNKCRAAPKLERRGGARRGGCRMSALDFTVIGFGSFVAMIAIGLVVLLAANRH